VPGLVGGFLLFQQVDQVYRGIESDLFAAVLDGLDAECGSDVISYGLPTGF
jgi:hypothetical protein